jgi:hypothetical protein
MVRKKLAMIDEQKKVNLRIFLAKKKKKVLICGEKKPFLIYTKERFFFFFNCQQNLNSKFMSCSPIE